MQKNASLRSRQVGLWNGSSGGRSRQVKNFASAGTRPKSMYGFGIMKYKVTVAEFTAH
jgi:hypothetical protein